MRHLALFLCALLSGCAASTPAPSTPSPEVTAPSATVLSADLQVRPLDPSTPNVLMHVSFMEVGEWGRVGSNGLVVLGEREALLVDTAWTDEQTAMLLDHVEASTGRRVTHAFVTHSHQDRIGGIRELLRRGVTVHGLALTAERAIAEGNPPPNAPFTGETTLDVDGVHAQAFFPGAGHAPDNLVVWLPDHGVLFGTCMIRSLADTVVGNLSDASLATWEDAVNTIRARVPWPRIVVPGHGEPGDGQLLHHTIELVRAGR